MTRIVMDDVLRDKLHGLKEIVEICDASGKILGRVVPVPSVPIYEELDPPISEEEREKRRKYTGPMFTTEQVLKHLEGL